MRRPSRFTVSWRRKSRRLICLTSPRRSTIWVFWIGPRTDQRRRGRFLVHAKKVKHSDARLAELARPIDQCLQGEHGFSAARTAEEEGRSISRQATAGD